MKFYKESGMYSWDFDRFHFFTESEKCFILETMKDAVEIYKGIPDFNVEGGLVEMVEYLIKEVEKSLL